MPQIVGIRRKGGRDFFFGFFDFILYILIIYIIYSNNLLFFFVFFKYPNKTILLLGVRTKLNPEKKNIQILFVFDCAKF